MKLFKETLDKLRGCFDTSASTNTLLEKIVCLALFNCSEIQDNHFNTPFTTRTFFL